MRNTVLCVALAVVGWMVCGNSRVAFAQEGTEHQATQHDEGTPPPLQHPDGAGRPMPVVRVLWPGNDMKSEIRCVVGIFRAILVVWLVCNVLLASWIFTDIRKLGQGHGIFIALALLAGFPAAILYAVVRIGDKKG
ncbi:MAG: hypothetical protein ABSD58_03300 [Verrucomicrobiia bacterium]